MILTLQDSIQERPFQVIVLRDAWLTYNLRQVREPLLWTALVVQTSSTNSKISYWAFSASRMYYRSLLLRKFLARF